MPACPWLRWTAWGLTALLLLQLGACSNSRLIIGPLYNRLDDRLQSRFTGLADFSESQQAQAATLIGHFHVWHRQNELPAYAALLDELRTTVGRSGPTDSVTAATIEGWFTAVRGLAERVRRCHPINFSAGLIGGMSDAQIGQMHRTVLADRAEDRRAASQRTPAERRARRAERFATWAGRIGIDLNDAQRAMLEATLERQTSLRRQYQSASDVWLQTLFDLFGMRRQPGFPDELQQHLQSLGGWLEKDYPARWSRNRALWEAFALDFIRSLTPGQRQAADDWLAGMADTLRTLSRVEPSFEAGDDAAQGCLTGDSPPKRLRGL